MDSVAPDVQTSSRGSQLTSAATFARASSTAASASQPTLCERDAGLPKICVSQWIVFDRGPRSRQAGRLDRTRAGVGAVVLHHGNVLRLGLLPALLRVHLGER